MNAKVYYLAPNGSDTNDGLTWETPWGPSIYVRLNNKTNNDAYVKNLLISAQLYNPSQTSVESTEDELLRVNYYDLFGRLLSTPRFGLLLKQSIYRSGKTTIEKVLYY